MSQTIFDELPEYSASRPSGVYEGKIWKRNNGAFDEMFLAKGGAPEWQLRWFGLSDKPNCVSNHTRKIVITQIEDGSANV